MITSRDLCSYTYFNANPQVLTNKNCFVVFMACHMSQSLFVIGNVQNNTGLISNEIIYFIGFHIIGDGRLTIWMPMEDCLKTTSLLWTDRGTPKKIIYVN